MAIVYFYSCIQAYVFVLLTCIYIAGQWPMRKNNNEKEI